MVLPQRRWLFHSAPSWVHSATYFITICCQIRGTDQLCAPATSSKLLAAMSHYQTAQRWHVFVWVLMPDHLHAIVSLPTEESLTKTVAAWKRFTAREAGIAWQRGFFDHRLRSDESLEEKAHYIRMNPVRNGLVAHPADWPHIWPC
ncbi:MAG: transposase [Verrucomicrobia bacterium]|nr:transposase [Verrucomicrobiota bacterium]